MWVRGHGYLELLLKLPSKWCILNLFPEKQRGNKCNTTSYQHVNMFIARNRYEMAILTYFVRGGLEKSKVPHLTHHTAGETPHCTCIYTLINRPL